MKPDVKNAFIVLVILLAAEIWWLAILEYQSYGSIELLVRLVVIFVTLVLGVTAIAIMSKT